MRFSYLSKVWTHQRGKNYSGLFLEFLLPKLISQEEDSLLTHLDRLLFVSHGCLCFHSTENYLHLCSGVRVCTWPLHI